MIFHSYVNLPEGISYGKIVGIKVRPISKEVPINGVEGMAVIGCIFLNAKLKWL